MNQHRILIGFLGATLVALWLGERVLATGLLLAAAAWARHLQHLELLTVEQFRQWAEEETRHDRISYPLLIRTAMEWANAGKGYVVPEGQDAANPQLLYVGLSVASGLDGQPTFLPELEVTADDIDRIKYLD